MKMFLIPEEVREEEYEDGGETWAGDGGKCGGCNWAVEQVYMMADTQEGANEAFRENHRGLCGECMSEMLMEDGNEIDPMGVKS